MIVRHATLEDVAAIRALHQRQGLEYTLPALNGPDMLVRAVIEEAGEVTHAVLLRKTAEVYWIFDTKRDKKREVLGKLMLLHKEITPSAKRAGLTDVHCWIPPQVSNLQFERTMYRLGWERPLWTSYCRKVE